MKKNRSAGEKPIVGVIMGSLSDLDTVEHTLRKLKDFGVPYEAKVVSAHRTPDAMMEYARSAEVRGLKVIIAAAGGAAHLPGMTASSTILPVIAIPILSSALHGVDSLLSIVQMPAGIPAATMAIGKPGAENAALQTMRILALSDKELADKLRVHEAGLRACVDEQNNILDRTLQEKNL